MTRSLTLSNGSLHVGIDAHAQVQDIYFPYVGSENHIGSENVHRIGVFVDGQFAWLDDGGFEIQIELADDSQTGVTQAMHANLGVALTIMDIVYNEKNIFIRKVAVRNLHSESREIKVYFAHQFEMYESHQAHTAYYDPLKHLIVHYRGKRVFAMRTHCEGKSFDDYTTGVYGIEGKEGSHFDAEDGNLAQNNIEHGPVDSVLGVYKQYSGNQEREVYYSMCVGTSLDEVRQLDGYVNEKTPKHIMTTTQNYWRAWINRRDFQFDGLSSAAIALFKRSLFFVRSHVDSEGAIIASTDSTMMQWGKDTYAYMWPRDGARSAVALYMSGSFNPARNFFEFVNEVISMEGYFLHKYGPDKTFGSSWHPWVRDGKAILPIQEDETALVIVSLWKYYELSKDIEFIEGVYNSLIKKAAEFMVMYRDPTNGLPRPSYDLWEEKYGVHTFTASAVFAALNASAEFAELLGKQNDAARYRTAATEVQAGILEYLFNTDSGLFYKMINYADGVVITDKTLDSSTVYGLFEFGVLAYDDPRMIHMVEEWEIRLQNRTSVGGIVRYENDAYQRKESSGLGNPWIICTLWLAQYHIVRSKNEEDLKIALRWIEWVVTHATSSGALSEQIDAQTGDPLSATPLTWSHSAYVTTVLEYLSKLEELGLCEDCNPLG